MAPVRTDQFALTVFVDGRALGVFDKLTGGEADSEETKYRPGAMAAQLSLGGSTSVSNITVSRAFDPERDGPLLPFLLASRGLKQAVASLQPLDQDRKPYGRPIVRQGKLKTVKSPEHDSEGNAAAMLELEISTDGDVA
jgi:hypothetical protein